MRIVIKMNGKKISKKKAMELIGSERLAKRIDDVFSDINSGNYDPYEVPHWMDGMSIEIYNT